MPVATAPFLPTAATKAAPPRPLVTPAELGAMRAELDGFLAAHLESQREEAGATGHPAFGLLYDDLKEFVCRPGKRLRPLLFLLAHRVFQENGGAAPPPRADLLPIAASLEFLHGFILIHDDIIDRSETRRSRPTLHRVIEHRLTPFSDRRRAGKNLALVMGDILFALAQKCLLAAPVDPTARLQLSAMLLGCMVETGFGEAADIVHGTRDVSKVSLEEIEQMYLLKTTRYTIECPLTMAALLAGAGGAEELAGIAAVARPAGLAFQIQNDLQEFARFEVSDAEVPADLLEGKKTLLLRTAYSLLNETDRALLGLCFSGAAPTEAAVSRARELVVKSGAVGRLHTRMETLFADADTATRTEVFRPAVREGLAGLIRLVRGATGT